MKRKCLSFSPLLFIPIFSYPILLIPSHTDKYYSKNLNLGPEEMPVDKKPVVSTVFHAIFTASVADTARICYLK